MKDLILINENSFEKIREKISENKEKEIVFTSDDDDLNLKVLEKLPINMLLVNLRERKDYQKQRNSGFNQVMAKLSKKNNVKLGVNLDEIIDSIGKQKSEILARIRQNIKLCNKNKVEIKFFSLNKKNKKDPYDLKSLGLVLGLKTELVVKI